MSSSLQFDFELDICLNFSRQKEMSGFHQSDLKTIYLSVNSIASLAEYFSKQVESTCTLKPCALFTAIFR